MFARMANGFGNRPLTALCTRNISYLQALSNKLGISKKVAKVDKQAEQLTPDSDINHVLSGKMEHFIYETLSAQKEAQSLATTPAQQYIANISAHQISSLDECGYVTQNLPYISPETPEFPFQNYFIGGYARSMGRCKSLVLSKNDDSIKDITERIVNCPMCLTNWLDFANRLKNASDFAKSNKEDLTKRFERSFNGQANEISTK